jgi:glycopeptide antibiotics resistance protein
VRRPPLWVLFAAGLFVLAADFPWDLQNHSHWATVGWIPFVSGPVRVVDIVQNVLLCSPIGWVAARRFPRRGQIVAAAVAASVSLVGEWTQLYSHTRFPSATDVVCNVTGAVAAAMIVRSRARAPSSSPR